MTDEPREFVSLIDEAYGHLEAGRYEASLRSFEAVVRIDSTYEALVEGIRSVVEMPKDPMRYFDLSSRLPEEKPDVAVSVLRQAVEIEPGNSAFHHALAVSLERLGELGEAERHHRFAVEREPKNALYLGDLGVMLYQAGRFRDAVGVLRRAVSLDPTKGRYHQNLGVVLSRLGDLAGSEQHLRRAVYLEPRNAYFLASLSRLLRDTRRSHEARLYDERREELDEAKARYHHDSGVRAKRLGDVAEAEAHFRRAVVLAPTTPSYLSNLGVLLHDAGQFEEAVAVHRLAVELDPVNAAFHRNLAVSLKGLGDLVEAERQVRRAVVLAPRNASYLNTLGVMLYQAGRFEEAVAELRRALHLDLTNPTRHFNLAVGLKRMGDVVEAEKHYRRAVELEPSNTEYHEAHARCVQSIGSSFTPDSADRVSHITSEEQTRSRPSSTATAAVPFDQGWCSPARWNETDLATIQILPEAYFSTWPLSDGVAAGMSASQSWLESILGRAEHLADDLKLVPHWPVVFSDDTTTVVITRGSRGSIRVWVGFFATDEGCVASFDPRSWDTFHRDSTIGRFTVGVGVALFLDVSLRLHQTNGISRSPLLRSAASGDPGTVNGSSSGLYLRRAASPEMPNSRPSERLWLPKTHRVRGTVRTLSGGRIPNPEQVAMAPEHIRRTMGPSDTYVRPHIRGGNEARRAILKALGRTTNLVDALATGLSDAGR